MQTDNIDDCEELIELHESNEKMDSLICAPRSTIRDSETAIQNLRSSNYDPEIAIQKMRSRNRSSETTIQKLQSRNRGERSLFLGINTHIFLKRN